MRIKRVYFFDAAHVLVGYSGKCANLHGHTYRVEVELDGEISRLSVPRPYRFMVLDFHDVDAVVKPIIEELDHALLLGSGEGYDRIAEALEPFKFKIVRIHPDPTAEMIALWLDARIEQGLRRLPVKLRSVTVYETDRAGAICDD